jgi:hypothetical protein
LSVDLFRCRSSGKLVLREAVMFGLVGRARRTWRAKARLIAPLWNSTPGLFFQPELYFPELRRVLEAGGPQLAPYDGLAAVWDEYGAAQLPDYPPSSATSPAVAGSNCGRFWTSPAAPAS